LEKGVDAVDRALTVMTAFTEAQSVLSLQELAQKTGFYKSTILRLCASLERFGYLNRGADGRFRLGPTCGRLGSVFQSSFDLEKYIRPVLAHLVEETSETASFYVRDKDRRVCLFRENSNRAIRHHVEEGDQLPLDRGAAGLALLAASDARGERFERIRREGYVVTLGERDPDAASIAATVFDAKGAPLGALAVSGLRSRFTSEVIDQLRKQLLTAVAQIESRLGRVKPQKSAAKKK
jgi:DNA-binding IclR family transcriptional regulator